MPSSAKRTLPALAEPLAPYGSSCREKREQNRNGVIDVPVLFPRILTPFLADNFFRIWWPGTESNRRRKPIQVRPISQLGTRFTDPMRFSHLLFGRQLDSEFE